MLLTLSTNQNVLFIRLIFALINPSEDINPFGKKILDEFAYIRDLDSYRLFKEYVKGECIGKNEYPYMFLTVHLNDDLTPKPLSPNDGYGPNRLKHYEDTVATYLQNIWKESKFNERYIEVIEPEYISIVQGLEKEISRFPTVDTLEGYWGIKVWKKYVIIPSPFGVFEGFSTSRGDTVYSITCSDRVNGVVSFTLNYLLWNSLHEFSHMFFREQLYGIPNLREENDALCSSLEERIQSVVPASILADYSDASDYLEEVYIRALQIHLNSIVWKGIKSKVVLDTMVSDAIRRLKEQGFVYIDTFYEAITETSVPMDAYMKGVKAVTVST